MSELQLISKTIRVVCGPMASGKTREYKNLFNRAKKANQPTLTFKSDHDKDAPPKTVLSRDGEPMAIDYDIHSLSQMIRIVKEYLHPINKRITQITAELYTNEQNLKLKELNKYYQRQKNLVILVDEVQFLDRDVPYTTIGEYCKEIDAIAFEGPQFIFFGLDLTHGVQPYKVTSMLSGVACDTIKRTSICEWCDKEGARKSKQVSDDVTGSYVTGKDKYYPACDKCYYDIRKDFNFLESKWQEEKNSKKILIIH